MTIQTQPRRPIVSTNAGLCDTGQIGANGIRCCTIIGFDRAGFLYIGNKKVHQALNSQVAVEYECFHAIGVRGRANGESTVGKMKQLHEYFGSLIHGREQV